MPDPYIGEICIFAGDFAPDGWALCNGQLLAISQHTALFSLLGVAFGGDGMTTFALPDMRGRAPMHWGAGPGLTRRRIGEVGGATTVTLLDSEMPRHAHGVQGSSGGSTTSDPEGSVWASGGRRSPPAYGSNADVPMSENALRSTGGSQPHNNLQPYLGLNFIIALEGIFPPRS